MFEDKLRNIHIKLSELSVDLYSYYDDKNAYSCKCMVDSLISSLLSKDFNHNLCYNKMSLLESLIFQLDNIENFSCHIKNYSYFAQMQRLSCITQNLKKLVCQVYCVCEFDNCELISELFSVLIRIVHILLHIVSYIINIETICCLDLCCKEKIIENLVCSFIEEIDCLSIVVSDLAKLILRIISLTISECIDNNDCLYSCKK
ncbi:MAG: hypothetical protein ACRC3Y_13810 [Romboutsia sp.]|uniref:hypothetical protein n=1 Tax=Romboutsia sp. TaxID=1965302 RepID=UPI003F3D9EE0